MVRMKSVIQRIKECSNDKGRWIIIFSNLSSIQLNLDNDETYIIPNNSDYSNQSWVKLDNYIGNSEGVCLLLEHLEVNFSLV